MSYLEELLPDFRKGAKIRIKDWEKDEYICIKNDLVVDENGVYHKDFYDEYLLSNEWEFYQEHIDWDYIIKNKCLCWFRDSTCDNYKLSFLAETYIDGGETRRFLDAEDTEWLRCIPVRRDEVAFYEEKKDE